MKTLTPAFLALLALAGPGSVPAFAGDGEKEKPTGAAGGEPKAKDGEGCKDKEKKGGECPDCAKEGKECCKEASACTDLEVVTLAAVEGTGEAAKKVLAAIPAAAAEKVEAARKTALEQMAKIQVAMGDLKKDFETACAEAKAKGEEVCCEMKATFEKDMKALQGKSQEQVALCARALRDALGEDKIKDLSAECRKAGDMAKVAAEKVRAAAAKLLEKRKAADAEEEDDEDEGDEADEADEAKGGEHGKEVEKGHGDAKPEKKDAK